MPNNLTRDEARARARLLTVESYDVRLDLTTGDEVFRSTTTVRFRCSEPGAPTFLELAAPRVHRVTLNGTELDAAAVFDGDRIRLEDLTEDNALVVDADCAYMHTGEGLHRFVDPVDGEVYLYSQFETYDAHRMYACFDQPDLKAAFTVTVTAPAHWEVVSNATAVATEPDGDRQVVRFAETPRMSTYITALIAGAYAVVRSEHDGIPLGIYCRRSVQEHLDADALFEVTRQGFDFFHRVFDYRYPFGKYDQLFVPEFNAGAMENAGAVTFLEDYLFRSKVTDAAYERRAETVLHEMAHMWFGDLVTMRWWDDLWLNESFATYMAVLAQAEATRWTGAWTTFANAEKTWALRQDQLPSTHPIAADIADIEAVEVNFDGITYAKGAAVLKQLVAWVGRDAFFDGLRTYFGKHEYANTELRDLLVELERGSGRDLKHWSSEWLETAGVSTLRPEVEVGPDGTYTAVTVVQEAPEGHPTLRSHRVALGLYTLDGDALRRTSRVELDVVGARTPVPDLVGTAQPDLLLVNDDDLTYVKLRLDERSLATLTSHVGGLEDSLARALCWSAAWDMTRDAEVGVRDFVRLVLSGIGRETDIGVVQSLLRQVSSGLTLFADPAAAPATWAGWTAFCEQSLREAAGGSDAQLLWVRALLGDATEPAHVALLHGLLAGTTDVPGLAVDTELRWSLLRRLVVLGVAGEAEIAAEERRDATATGARLGRAVRAARPDAAAKAEAWRLVVESDELPNAVHSAVAAAFWQASQLELCRPYVERYFDVIEDLWATRTNETAQTVVTLLYPTLLVEQETVDRTDTYLAGRPHLPPALRRLLLEARDGVARSLRARARDAADG